MFNLFSLHPPYFEVFEKCWQQFMMVTVSTLAAMLIGIPFAIAIRNSKKIKEFIEAVVNVLQTIPSLALLTILVPLVGIGYLPAITALIIYALLPIVRNTLIGFTTISPQSLEAATCLGCTPLQRLYLVELPLAMPTIMIGIRMAAVMTAGFATLASFVGAGGLGDFINRGLALNDPTLVLWGAIPAAFFALILDYIFKLNWKVVVTLFVTIFLGASFYLFNFHQRHLEIRVASKNFTEQLILAEIISELLEAKTKYHVIRKFNLGTTAICQQALINNDIDLYPEYTGTAYMSVLKYPLDSDRKKVFETVKDAYLRQFNLVWLAPFGFENTQRIAVTKEFAKKHKLQKMSQLKLFAPKMVLAAPPEFTTRPDGAILLEKAYGVRFKKIKAFEPGLIYQAIKHHQVDAVVAFSTDGKVEQNKLVLLEDDLHKTPPYDAAIVIRNELVEKYPEISEILQWLAYEIDESTMRQMNNAVEQKKKTIVEVAHEFLARKQL